MKNFIIKVDDIRAIERIKQYGTIIWQSEYDKFLCILKTRSNIEFLEKVKGILSVGTNIEDHKINEFNE